MLKNHAARQDPRYSITPPAPYGRRPRPCFDPQGNFHASMSDAARATQTPLSTIASALVLGKRGWRYATQQDLPASTITP